MTQFFSPRHIMSPPTDNPPTSATSNSPVFDDASTALADETLTPILEQVETKVCRFLQQNMRAFWFSLFAALGLIISPLLVSCYNATTGKEWSETVKNVGESAAILIAAFAAIKWANERRDRATTVLLELEKKFQEGDIAKGKKMLERGEFEKSDDPNHASQRNQCLDALLRFYVLLYGVLRARQVPAASLSYCFRYWLAHYFKADCHEFRRYVNKYYPSTRAWLRRDWNEGGKFFRPNDFFKEDELAAEFRQSIPSANK
jgi:hypothetical protein